MTSGYEERSPPSTIRQKWRVLRLLAITLLAGGTLTTLVLLMGAADPPTEDAILVEFRNLGAQGSAAGFRIDTDAGDYTILVTRDGYLSISTRDPDWRPFPHVESQHNRLLLMQRSPGDTAVLYINGERAWEALLGEIRACRIIMTGTAEVAWEGWQRCEGGAALPDSGN
jgi:hypothetical protein